MEINKSRKCCFCLPLRKGLLCLGYSKLIMCLLGIAAHVIVCVGTFMTMNDSLEDSMKFIRSMGAVTPQLLELIFTMIFIIAAHTKSVKLLEVYYFYSITMLLIYTAVIVLTACDITRFDVLYYVVFQHAVYTDHMYYEYIAIGTTFTLLHTYMTVLVGSEVNQLKERSRNEHVRRQSSLTAFKLLKANTPE